MEYIKRIIKEIFSSVDTYFLVRQYFFSIAVFLFIVFSNPFNLKGFIFILLSTILYPFARITFDYAFSFLLGNTTFVLPVILMFFIKIAEFVFLYAFSMFIAPISIIFILIRNRVLNK